MLSGLETPSDECQQLVIKEYPPRVAMTKRVPWLDCSLRVAAGATILPLVVRRRLRCLFWIDVAAKPQEQNGPTHLSARYVSTRYVLRFKPSVAGLHLQPWYVGKAGY